MGQPFILKLLWFYGVIVSPAVLASAELAIFRKAGIVSGDSSKLADLALFGIGYALAHLQTWLLIRAYARLALPRGAVVSVNTAAAIYWLVGLASAAFYAGGSRPTPPTVVLYCAQDQVFAEPILAEFTKQTGIAVKPVFDSEAVKTVGLANRLLAERGHPVCDVFWGNEEFRTRQLAAAGVFRATTGWTAFGQRSRRLVVRQDRFAEVFSNQYSVGHSPRPLKTDSLNTEHFAFTALTNAAFRGRVSLAFPLFGTTATHFLALRQHWGESNWLAWCHALAANRPFLEEGNSHVVKRVARGEALIGLTDSDDITAAQREGLPVTALPIFPESLLIPNTLGLIAKPKPNPAADKLYEFLQSPAVREQLIAAAALEAETPATNTLRPDWVVLLCDLDRATDQLKEVFRR